MISGFEKQILLEVMNMAIGHASREWEEIVKTPLELYAPEEFKEEFSFSNKSITIDKRFMGNLSGLSLVFFPHGINGDVISQLSTWDDETLKECVPLEIGNILLNGTLEKLVELLKSTEKYSEPRLSIGKSEEIFSEKSSIIVKSSFKLTEFNLHGSLFVLFEKQSMTWLKHSLNSFIDAYR